MNEVGVFFHNQDWEAEPAYRVSRQEARDLKQAGQAFFINHGKDIRLLAIQPKDNSDTLAGGTMRDSWQIKDSGGYPVWQMPSASKQVTENI